MIRTGIIVGSGGILFGYDIGVVAGALDQLGDEFNLDDWQKGMVVSLISAGSIIGCIVGGPVCDYFGRWFTIHLQNIVFIVGALTIAFASSIDTVYVGRVIVGIAAALSGIADCAYLNEVAPTEYRGRLSSLYELLTCVGVLLSFIIDLCLAEDSNGWRIMFGLPSIFALIQSLALFTMPETPKWLAQQKRYGECEEVLLHIYGDKEAASHAYQEIQEELRTDAQPVSNYNPLHRSSGEKREDPLPAPSSSPSSSSPSSAVLWREYRIPLIVILALQILSQLSGMISSYG